MSGGNGNDAILLDAGNSVALGGNSDDTLRSTGSLGNTLWGGNGDDLLISSGGGSGMSPGNTLTGGLGEDSFRLISGTGNLVVLGDAGGNGVVSDGDRFLGPIDVITDFGRGDRIALRNFGGTEDLPPPIRASGAALIDDPFPQAADRFRPVVGDGKYAVFQGTLDAGNLFTVDAEGNDLFIAYDTLDGNDSRVGQGSFVLLGVREEELMAEAFALATAPGTADDAGGGDQGIAGIYLSLDSGGPGGPASLDDPAAMPSIADLIAA